jgi:hypothetical protein
MTSDARSPMPIDLFPPDPPTIRRGATFSGNGTLRLTLTREWDHRPKVCFIGHNPSTADHLVDDPTVRRWMHFARAWGYGGFVAVNLYPIRTPDPTEARTWANWEARQDWGARDDLHRNVDLVAQEAKASGLVVACWGAIAQDDGWIEHVLEKITSGAEPWPSVYAFGLTKACAPIHPMARGKSRVPDDAMPIMWRKGTDSNGPSAKADGFALPVKRRALQEP